MKKLSFLILVVLGAIQPLWAASGPGTTGADILEVPIGVRPEALGGAYSALGDDIYVIGYNPAGLSSITKYSLGVDHIEGVAGIEVEALSVAVPTQSYGNLGFQLVYRHMPTINNVLATDPPVNADDFLFIVGDSEQIGKLALGGSLKTIVSDLGSEQAFTSAIDLGTRLEVDDAELALVMQNLGPSVKYQPGGQVTDPLPLTFRFGIARPILVSPSSTLLASADAFTIQNEDNGAAVGVEYWHRSLLALRVGYQWTGANDLQGGFSAGAAVRISIDQLECEFGYTWHPEVVSSDFLASSSTFGLLFWY